MLLETTAVADDSRWMVHNAARMFGMLDDYIMDVETDESIKHAIETMEWNGDLEPRFEDFESTDAYYDACTEYDLAVNELQCELLDGLITPIELDAGLVNEAIDYLQTYSPIEAIEDEIEDLIEELEYFATDLENGAYSPMNALNLSDEFYRRLTFLEQYLTD